MIFALFFQPAKLKFGLQPKLKLWTPAKLCLSNRFWISLKYFKDVDTFSAPFDFDVVKKSSGILRRIRQVIKRTLANNE
ncbi:MAG: hypothetical protein B6247_22100 [Candidatus Parabeggiatoa sp. nov. 2]|nr:MAG: hypothetical protein B6247_22100 [Beggiatoa sp. 4572_84]